MRAVEYNMRDIGRGQPELEKAVRLFQIHLLRVIKLPIVITGKTPSQCSYQQSLTQTDGQDLTSVGNAVT